MLIVGGTLALTAILLYLGWHFYRQWRLGLRQRQAERHQALRDGRPAQQAEAARELDAVQ